MSLRKNVIANYASQIYVAAIGILILPLYIKYMGAEAYGLVGVFTMLQAWFGLLDMGLTPTIARETARYRGGSMSALAYRQLFRALSVIFVFIAVLGGGIIWFMSDFIANKWLNIEELGTREVIIAVQIMAISLALRWLGGLYRGVITGSERLVWLSGFNIVIASLRFIAVFVSMWLYGFTPLVFFLHQLAVAFFEVSGLFFMTSLLKPSLSKLAEPIGWSFKPIKPVLKFALTIAFTSSVWILVTQTDKLILSGILPLAEYGYFTLAVLVAGGIMILSTPISIVIMPRMARLHAESKQDEMINVYRSSTQLVSVLAGSAAIVVAVYAEALVYAWTGDHSIASNAAPILRLYVLGNGVLAVAAFPYYLQYALGNLRYHLIGNAIIVLTLIPAVIIAATYYGGVGAGYAWLGINTLYLITWVGYVHHKLVPGLHLSWIIKDVLCIYTPVSILLISCSFIWPLEGNDRWIIIISLGLISVVAIAVASLASNIMRDKISTKIKGFL